MWERERKRGRGKGTEKESEGEGSEIMDMLSLKNNGDVERAVFISLKNAYTGHTVF